MNQHSNWLKCGNRRLGMCVVAVRKFDLTTAGPTTPCCYSTSCIQRLVTFVVVSAVLFSSVSCDLQRFVERPMNTSVLQGHTAILRCEIENLVGRVQWTKDGFALGFKRSIAGYPRYTMVGQHPNEHHLMIKNVSRRDTDEYQCQATPGRADQRRLVASAFLTVLVPCDPPTINGHRNGSTVDVFPMQASVQLVCESHNGYPAPDLRWLLNHSKPAAKNVTNEIISYSDDAQLSYPRSTMTLSLHGLLYDRLEIWCSARNAATQTYALSSYVLLNILSPPGPPQLSGYHVGQPVRANETVELVCRSTGGNPLGSVVWYRGDGRVDSSFTSGAGTAVNRYSFIAAAADDGAVYHCDVSNRVTPSPLSANLTLLVLFPPQQVTMSGGSGRLMVDDAIRLTCLSSNSNPPANITWYNRSVRLPESRVTSSYRVSELGGFVTQSEVAVTMSRDKHNDVYTCQASNDIGQTVSTSTTLSVLYPPQPPTISGMPTSASIAINELERLTCMAIGGNPPAILKWYKNDRLLANSVYKVIGDLAEAKISLLAQKDDNGAVYKCTANNSAILRPLVATVTLFVLFPPSSVTIIPSTSRPLDGRGMNLTCTSSSSNPAAVIWWLRGGRRVQGVNRGTAEGDHGGKTTTSILHFIPTSSDHGAEYSCRATNTLLGLSASDAVTLDVLFRPEFRSPVKSLVEMTEGESRSMNLSADANPVPVNYRLSRNGTSLSLPGDLPRFQLTKQGILTITQLRREDSGNYTVKAENSRGSGVLNFSIVVKYAASIVNITSMVLADEGGMAFFECVAAAYPVVRRSVTWRRAGYDMLSKTVQRTDGLTAYLTVYQLNRRDTGRFHCVADNGIGDPATAAAQLIVRYAPVIDKSSEKSKAAIDTGLTATLTCDGEGAPDIDFTWFKDGVVLDITTSKYSVEVVRRGLVNYSSSLTVRSVTRDDYGRYNCSAVNSLGSDSFLLLLHRTSKPDPPYGLNVVNVSHDSITVSWEAGFDGGLEQFYRVRYKPTQTVGYMYVDVPRAAATSFTLMGLKSGIQYKMAVLSFNRLGESAYVARDVQASTSDFDLRSDLSGARVPGVSGQVPVVVVLIVCIVGIVLLTLNVGLVLLFVHRRRKRTESDSDTTSHTNTLEMYGGTCSADRTIFQQASTDDDLRHSCDKNLDDGFSDDFNRDSEEYATNGSLTPIRMDSLADSTDQLMSGQRRLSAMHIAGLRVACPRSGRLRALCDDGDILCNGGPTHYRNISRPKSFTELSARTTSCHASSSGRTPPPPPVRSSSHVDPYQLHSPVYTDRTYEPRHRLHRLAQPSGNYLPDTARQLVSSGPPSVTSPHSQLASVPEVRGHLV